MIMAKKKPAKSPGPTWAEKLHALRTRWGVDGKPLTQELAAARLGVSRRSWISWETDGTLPSPPVRVLIDLLHDNPTVLPPVPPEVK